MRGTLPRIVQTCRCGGGYRGIGAEGGVEGMGRWDLGGLSICKETKVWFDDALRNAKRDHALRLTERSPVRARHRLKS